MIKIKTFEIVGYDAYQDILPELQVYLAVLKDDSYAYEMALNEAVCNAARYSVDGPEKARIGVTLRFTDYDLVAKVTSKTHPFDVAAYREKLRSIAARPELSEADWTDYTAESDASRGFWYMLRGTEYLYMAHDAQSVRLCTTIPCNTCVTEKMSDLLRRFYIEKGGTLIL